MNILLTEQIIKQILANFLIISSDYINTNSSRSLMDKDFLLKEKIKIELEDSSVIKNNIYGCQLSCADQEIKILLGDCTQDKNTPEYCLIVQLKNTPIYGCYLVYHSDNIGGDPLIAYSLDNKTWMPCTTYLQATFLAGMEQIKEIGFSSAKCHDYQSQFDAMISFLSYYDSFYETENARQEN